jgi:hypothetical protein
VQVKVNRRGVYVDPSDRMVRVVAPDASSPEARGTSETTRALSGLVPLADEPLRVAVAPFAASKRAARGVSQESVAVMLGLELPSAAPRGADETIALETRVFDGEGRVQIDTRRRELRVSAAARGSGRYEVLSTLSLEPGRYNLRFSSQSAARNKSGSVFTDVIVPDFGKDPLSLSGLVLGVEPPIATTRRNEFASLLPIVPTTRRDFGLGERVTAFLRVYWGGDEAGQPVGIQARIVDATNTVVFERQSSAAPQTAASPRSADVRIELPLVGRRIGEYLLTIEATRPGEVPIRRDARFRVR